MLDAMTTFRDTEQLYEVLDRLFTRLAAEPKVADAMLAGKFVLRFRYREPDGIATIDLRQPSLHWTFGDSPLEPDLEMIQSADTAHQFWLGKLNVPRAIATRQVVSRGAVAKALKLLPAVKPAFPIYAEVLDELGYEQLLPREDSKQEGLIDRAVRAAKGLGETLLQRGRPSTVATQVDSLVRQQIPLVDELATPAVGTAPAELPQDPIELRREMLRRMMLIRAFEQKLSEAWADGEVPTEAIHLCIGQEATAVGVCFALRVNDYIASTHRGHGHMLAKGADLDGMMAELLGKASGLCKGKGGSMHVTDAAVGAIGANGIVGASPLMAAGAGHSARLRGSDQVAVAFMGDGATNQGMFHEALNFAAVFDLPCVFVVENNLYGEFTAVGRHTRVERLSDRAAAYGIEGLTVDGNDIWAVFEATQKAVARARAGKGPTLLECLTYRWHGHMEGESVDYRPAEEIAAWKSACPIKRWRSALADEELLDAPAADGLDEQIHAEVQQAFERAAAAEEPEATELATEIFAPELRTLFQPTTPIPTTREITYSQALFEALAEELERDPNCYLIGEDVSTGGYFAVTIGLIDRFGGDRIIDTPISEYAIAGSAVGAAMCGSRPIVEILFSDFLTTCMDPLVNQAAKLRYMSGGQYAVPMVVRTPGGAGLGMAAQHSQSLEAWLAAIPGLLIVAPATPYDAKGMLKAAVRSNNPVLFFENKLLYPSMGPVPDEDYVVPIGVADVKRQGNDVTVVTIGAALSKGLEAAEQLASEGVSVEVVDVRSVAPLDLPTIMTSVAKTGRLVTVEDAPIGFGFGAELVARVVGAGWDSLRAPPQRVAAKHVPIAYNSRLENLTLPDVEGVLSAIRAALTASTGRWALPW